MVRSMLVVAATTAAAVAVGSAGALAVVLGRERSAPAPDSGPAAVTEVRRQTLAASVTVGGELGYGEAAPLKSAAGGMVTWLPGPGRVIPPGGTVLRADNRRVVLLDGVLPLYRPLSVGAEGDDVLQFERNLRALGQDGFTVDKEYTGATATAVRRWQRKLGLPRTGTVDPSWVIVADGPVRVAEARVRVGDPATGEILTWTGAAPVVTVDAKADAAGWAVPGTRVSVELPDRRTAKGRVTKVGAKATAEDGGDPTVPVTVTLDDARATGRLREAPVKVTYTGEQRRNVLAVPVAALVALAEGGYGLQVVQDGASRYVPVRVGLFAGGHVEVSGPGLTDGTVVGMPA